MEKSSSQGGSAWLRSFLENDLHPFRSQELPTVFVIEDDGDIARGLSYMLSPAYRIATADGSDHTLELVESERPDLLLVDFRLPAMNGIELMTALRARGTAAPAIMLSAYGNQREASLRAGFDAFILKPWDNRELVWHIESALRAA